MSPRTQNVVVNLTADTTAAMLGLADMMDCMAEYHEARAAHHTYAAEDARRKARDWRENVAKVRAAQGDTETP